MVTVGRFAAAEAFLPTILATRSRISAAALFVKVSADDGRGGHAALEQAGDRGA